MPCLASIGSLTCRRNLLLFELAGRRFALPSADVVHLVRAVSVQPLPGAPVVVAGIIDLHGEVMPVLDLRARFGFSAKALEPSDTFIIVAAGPRHVAIQVDRAVDLVELEVAPIENAANLPYDLASIAGLASCADGLILIQDLAIFLSASESMSLDGALRRSSPAPAISVGVGPGPGAPSP
jgi:purine-binding chemotaxis protein CheW